MALETPNAIVVSAVFYLNTGLPIGQQVAVRSSTGIKAKTLETMTGGGGLTLAAFSLEQPVDNDEGCILTQGLPLSGQGLINLFAWISPLAQQLGPGFSEVDTLAADQLALLTDAKPNSLARMTVSVLSLITTVPPIPNEPVP